MNFKEMTLLQLKAYAKEKGIRGVSTLKKNQLIERIIASENKSIQTKAEESIKSEKNTTSENGIKTEKNAKSENGIKTEGGPKAEKRVKTEENSKSEDNIRKTQQKPQESEKKEKVYHHNDRENGNSVNSANDENAGKENKKSELSSLDSGNMADGILEVMPDGYGFIRCENYLPGENDVYVSPSQIRRFNLKTGDILVGNIRIKTQNEKYSALLYVQSVNGYKPFDAAKRKNFEDLTPVFPNERISLETENAPLSMRMVDLLSPIGKGQRGMIVSQPKTGKTTLLKQIARSITATRPNMKVIVLLIDERPEEVTDIRESIEGPNAEVIYSTFDELPEHHKRVSEMVLERAKRLVEHKQDVVILLDSITRLARAYNLLVPPSGRTLSGGLDPAEVLLSLQPHLLRLEARWMTLYSKNLKEPVTWSLYWTVNWQKREFSRQSISSVLEQDEKTFSYPKKNRKLYTPFTEKCPETAQKKIWSRYLTSSNGQKIIKNLFR